MAARQRAHGTSPAFPHTGHRHPSNTGATVRRGCVALTFDPMASLIIGATAGELLTPEWLSDALGLPISDVELTKVGTGQIGDCERLTLTYSERCDGPATLVAKVPSHEPTSRNAGVALGTYRKEANFYMQLRDKVQ